MRNQTRAKRPSWMWFLLAVVLIGAVVYVSLRGLGREDAAVTSGPAEASTRKDEVLEAKTKPMRLAEPLSEVADIAESEGVRLGAEADRHADRLKKKKEIPPLSWHQERVQAIGSESLDQLIAHVANIDDMHFAATASSDSGYMRGQPQSEARVLPLLFRVRRILEMGRKDPAPVVTALQRTFRRNLAEWPAIHRAALKTHEQYANRAMFGDLPKSILARNLARMQAAVATYVLAELGSHASLPLLLEGYEKQVKWIDAIPVEKYRWTPQCPVPPPLTLYAMHRLISTLPKSRIPASAAAEYDRYAAWSAKNLQKPFRFMGSRPSASYDESDPRIRIMDPRGLLLDDQPKMELYTWPMQWTDGTDMQEYPAAPYLNERTRKWLALMKPVIKKTFAQAPGAQK